MLVVAPRAPGQLHTKALWPCSGVQGWKWSEAMTEVKPDSSACLHHLKRSVGWNCSNIAAYPTVPVLPKFSPLSAALDGFYIGKGGRRIRRKKPAGLD